MFKRLTITSKLLVGFGTLLLLIVSLSTILGTSSLSSRDNIEELARLKHNEVLDQRVEKRVAETRMQVWMALATGDKDHWSKAAEILTIANDKLDELNKNTRDPGRLAKIDSLRDLIKKYTGVVAQFKSLSDGRNDVLATAEGKAITAEAMKTGADISGVGELLSDSFADASEKMERSTRDSAALMIKVAAIAGISSVIIGLGLAFQISRSIRQPVTGLTHVMTDLAKGDLDVTVQNTEEKNEIGEMARAVLVFKNSAIANARLERQAAEQRQEAERQRIRNDEAQVQAIANERAIVASSIGEALSKLASKDLTFRMPADIPEAYRKLQADFNGAIAQLEDALSHVSGSTYSIASGSKEITTASDDLALRTEQQAASIEETAAALEEITTTVKKSAEGARHASKVVSAADADAKKSVHVVRQTVEAMDGISKSSQQINQIIGVIDEIAFQTNLLALNAGVEAARAGDAGRGFAVVASEVRALAQRSAEAAKEIKGLISASTTQVENGVKLVAETGQSLERIMAQVSEINEVIAVIASGAQEQATGLEQINTAINQMDQATQRNAAMVEEATAASHSMKEETEQLASLVGEFRIGTARAA